MRPAIDECLTALGRYPEVNSELSPRDLGFNPERPANYAALGQLGLNAVRLALLASQRGRPQSILDVPSGHGRVLRYLRAEYPHVEMAACDIDHEAVEFCARVFNVTPILGHEHPADVDLPRQYDLIWCGSLLTHLNKPMWSEFFDFFERALSPGGLLVVSVQSRYWIRKLHDPEVQDFVIYGEDRRSKILREYEETGFGFSEYPSSPEKRAELSEPASYGISVVKLSWLWRFLELRPLVAVTHMEGRWGDQDVIGLVKPR